MSEEVCAMREVEKRKEDTRGGKRDEGWKREGDVGCGGCWDVKDACLLSPWTLKSISALTLIS